MIGLYVLAHVCHHEPRKSLFALCQGLNLPKTST